MRWTPSVASGKLIQTATGRRRNGSSKVPRRATMTYRDPRASGGRAARRQGGRKVRAYAGAAAGGRRRKGVRDDGYDWASRPMHSSPSRVCNTSGV